MPLYRAFPLAPADVVAGDEGSSMINAAEVSATRSDADPLRVALTWLTGLSGMGNQICLNHPDHPN
jgi:hypothetical protein